MSDREILDKYVDLYKSCLTDKEKKQVMDMLYKYKDTFIYKSSFFIRLYHVKEEDKNFIDKKMKRLCYLSILKDTFLVLGSS